VLMKWKEKKDRTSMNKSKSERCALIKMKELII
jgi:hypothetical protein